MPLVDVRFSLFPLPELPERARLPAVCLVLLENVIVAVRPVAERSPVIVLSPVIFTLPLIVRLAKVLEPLKVAGVPEVFLEAVRVTVPVLVLCEKVPLDKSTSLSKITLPLQVSEPLFTRADSTSMLFTSVRVPEFVSVVVEPEIFDELSVMPVVDWKLLDCTSSTSPAVTVAAELFVLFNIGAFIFKVFEPPAISSSKSISVALRVTESALRVITPL